MRSMVRWHTTQAGNGNDGNLALGATWTDGIIGNAISINMSQYMTSNVKYKPASDPSGQSYSAWVKVEGQSWKATDQMHQLTVQYI